MELKDARNNAGMTQQNVADNLGISRPTYIKMEQHPETISMGDAAKLAEMFGTTVNDIFFESNYKETYSSDNSDTHAEPAVGDAGGHRPSGRAL